MLSDQFRCYSFAMGRIMYQYALVRPCVTYITTSVVHNYSVEIHTTCLAYPSRLLKAYVIEGDQHLCN